MSIRYHWAFKMIQRQRILQQSVIFLKQNPGEAHPTIEELCEMAASNNANNACWKFAGHNLFQTVGI